MGRKYGTSTLEKRLFTLGGCNRILLGHMAPVVQTALDIAMQRINHCSVDIEVLGKPIALSTE